MKKYINPLVTIITIGVLLFSLYDLKKQTNQVPKLQQEVNTLQHKVDSLYDENYPCQIELNRFQTAYKIFLRRNPKAAEQYGTIISEETE